MECMDEHFTAHKRTRAGHFEQIRNANYLENFWKDQLRGTTGTKRNKYCQECNKVSFGVCCSAKSFLNALSKCVAILYSNNTSIRSCISMFVTSSNMLLNVDCERYWVCPSSNESPLCRIQTICRGYERCQHWLGLFFHLPVLLISWN